MSDNEILREFLLETHENLALLDDDLLHLERHPADRSRLSQVFRTFHSIKGTAGFMGLNKLQTVAHSAENLLSHLRSGEMLLNQSIATVLLQLVDGIREIVANVEGSGGEGPGDYSAPLAEVDRLLQSSVPSQQLPVTMELPPIPAAPLPPPLPESPAPESPEPGSVSPVASPLDVRPPDSRPPDVTLADVPLADVTLADVTLQGSPDPAEIWHREASEVKESLSGGATESSLRVDVRRLDQLMTLVGELVLARNQLLRYRETYQEQGFLNAVQRLDLLTSDLQASVMQTRLQPIGTVLNRFPRVVRDLALACGKSIRLELEGQETELDKTLIEAIRDPLTHLVRNAIDHGIEPPEERRSRNKPEEGVLRIVAFHEGGKVIVEISDDGGGIDVDRVRQRAIQAGLVSSDGAARMSSQDLLQLVFLPGFSTAQQVTQYSGRGVGMDVVRTNLERIGGTVELDSTPGLGTKVHARIPLTLTIIPALIVACGQERFAIPQSSLLELVRLEPEQALREIEYVHDAPVYRLRGKLVPLIFLDDQLRLPSMRTPEFAANLVILQVDDQSFGLVVDSVHDVEEIVVKPLQKQLKEVGVFAGAAIMGDGRIALVMDVLSLAQRAHVIGASQGCEVTEQRRSSLSAVIPGEPVLLFSARPGHQSAIPLSQVARLEEIPRSKLEQVRSGSVVQCRGEILPLIDLAGALKTTAHDHPVCDATGLLANINGTNESALSGDDSNEARERLVVIVVVQDDRRLGLIVNRILDIVHEPTIVASQTSSQGQARTAILMDRVTELTDVDTILRERTSSSVSPGD